MAKRDPYAVGQLVEHPKRPEWGPGRIVAMAEGRIHVFFRDDLEGKAKVILAELVALRICPTQDDTILSDLPAARFDGQYWVLPKPKRSKSAAPVEKKQPSLARH